MVLLVSSSPGKMEELLGKFNVDLLSLKLMEQTGVDNFLVFVGGSRLHGLHERNSDIDLYGYYVPPLADLTHFETPEKVLNAKFDIPSETGRVVLPVSVKLMPLQRAMKQAYYFDGDIWKNMSLITRYASDWVVHESVSKDGSYNLMHFFEDTASRLVPHLPRGCLEPYYRGVASSYLDSIKKQLGDNDATQLKKFLIRFYHTLAMWRDSRVQWPVGLTSWRDLRNLDHAVPLVAFEKLKTSFHKDRQQVLEDVISEFESVKEGSPKNLKPYHGATFKQQFDHLLKPALRRLYKL